MKLTLDGITVELEDQAAQLVSKAVADRDTAVEAANADAVKLKDELAAEKARADKAEEDLAASEQARKDAEDPKAVRERVDARLELERQSTAILGADVKVDGMSDDEIRSAVVVKTSKDPEGVKAKLEKNDATYLLVRYDAAIEGFDPDQKVEPNKALAGVRSSANKAQPRGDAADARQRMIEAKQKLGTEPLRA